MADINVNREVERSERNKQILLDILERDVNTREQLQKYYIDLAVCVKKKVIDLDGYKQIVNRTNFDSSKSFYGIADEFGYRKDTRTFGDFAVDIFKETHFEGFCVDFFCKNYSHLHFGETVKYKHCGIEESGALVLQKEHSRDEFKKADFELSGNNTSLFLECKKNPAKFKATYKVADLRHYCKKQYWVLTMVLDIDKISAKPHSYYLFSPETLTKILGDVDSGKIKTFQGHEVGATKEAIQFYTESGADRLKSVSPNAVCWTNYFDIRIIDTHENFCCC